jgi:hypothetical protein
MRQKGQVCMFLPLIKNRNSELPVLQVLSHNVSEANSLSFLGRQKNEETLVCWGSQQR